MKKLVALIIIAMPIILFAQKKEWANGIYYEEEKKGESFNGFTCRDFVVFWQKIYTFDPIDSSAIFNFFYKNLEFNMIDNSGVTKKKAIDFRKYGIGRMFTSGALLSPCEIYFKVEIKENRYRITVDNVVWFLAVTMAGSMSNSNSSVVLTDAAFKKNGKVTDIFYNQVSNHLNLAFTDIFDYNRKIASAGPDEW